MVYHPYTGTLIVGGYKGQVRFIDQKTGRLIRELIGHTDYINAICPSPDGKIIVTNSDDNTIKVWNAETGNCLQTLTSDKIFFHTLHFFEDGKKLIGNNNRKLLRIWETSRFSVIDNIEFSSIDIKSLKILPDNRHVIFGNSKGQVVVYDLLRKAIIRKVDAHQQMSTSIVLLPRQNQFLTGSWDRFAKAWSIENMERSLTFAGFDRALTELAADEAGKTVVGGDMGGTIRIWRTEMDVKMTPSEADYLNWRSFVDVYRTNTNDVYVDALETAQQTYNAFPSQEKLVAVGAAYYRTGKFDKAIDNLLAAIGNRTLDQFSRKARYPASMAFLAMSHFQLNNLSEARKYQQRARVLTDSKVFEGYFNLRDLMEEVDEMLGVLNPPDE